MKRITSCRLLPASCLVLALVWSGCAGLDQYLGQRKPDAHISGVGFQDIGLDALTLLFDVEVSNPYSVPLPLANIDYKLSSNGSTFLTGDSALQGTVSPNSSKTLALPARIPYDQLLNVIKGVKPGAVVPYQADMGLSVNAPGIGSINLPLQKSGNVPIPAVPEISVNSIRWDSLSLNEAAGHIDLSVVNHNQFPLDFSKFNYAFTLGGVEVAKSALEKSANLKADGGKASFTIPLSFAPKDAGLGLFRMLTGSSGAYGISGDLDVTTPYGPINFPLKGSGEAQFQK